VSIRVISDGHECSSVNDLKQHFNVLDVIRLLDMEQDTDGRLARWLAKQQGCEDTLKQIREVRTQYKEKKLNEKGVTKILCAFFPEYFRNTTLEDWVRRHKPSGNDDVLTMSIFKWTIHNSTSPQTRKMAAARLKDYDDTFSLEYIKALYKCWWEDSNSLEEIEEKDLLGGLSQLQDISEDDQELVRMTIGEKHMSDPEFQFAVPFYIEIEGVKSTWSNVAYKKMLDELLRPLKQSYVPLKVKDDVYNEIRGRIKREQNSANKEILKFVGCSIVGEVPRLSSPLYIEMFLAMARLRLNYTLENVIDSNFKKMFYNRILFKWLQTAIVPSDKIQEELKRRGLNWSWKPKKNDKLMDSIKGIINKPNWSGRTIPEYFVLHLYELEQPYE